LFTGIEGVGKRTTARLFAKALNCVGASQSMPEANSGSADRPCGRCRSCRQIQEGGHPDVIEVSPRKGVLRIDQIRSLINKLSLKPFGAGQRVVIISEAHALNQEAGNALLKVLEEPPAGTILILTALQHTDLLPTIASRCRHIRFRPLCVDDLTTLLTTQQGMEAEQARTLAEVADGSYSRALHLAESQWGAMRDWIVGAAGLDQPERPVAYSVSYALAFAAQIALRKERIDNNLEILKTWIRDLGVSNHRPGHVINRDRAALLQTMRGRIRDGQITRMFQAVESAQRSIAANGNLRLTLDVMALQMANAMTA
jgi:DNA polymerase-3 subunit delta'